MNIMLTEQLKNEIRQIFNRDKIKRTWLFNEAPTSRKHTGLSRFGVQIADDEDIILFHDSTMFGTGREGLILTTTTLYWKEIAHDARSLALKNVKSFTWNGMLTGMAIESNDSNNDCRIITEHGKKLAVFLNSLLPLLITPDEPKQATIPSSANSSENWRCTGCKAVNVATNTHCEWCRKPKFVEPSERPQSQVNQTDQQVDVNNILNNVNNMLGNMNLNNGSFTSTSSTTTVNGQTVNSSEMTAEQKQQFDEAFKDFGNFFNN